MLFSHWHGRQLSRLMLGTVQFGLPYGIANRAGQPSQANVVRIVAAALEGGVNCFDTAAAYGTSEQALGDALAELRATADVVVVTKIRPLTPEELSDPLSGQEAVVRSVDESRRRLRMDTLPVVLFHREADAVFLPVLQDLQVKGRIAACGVSCDHDPRSPSAFIESGLVHALQLPGNLLDRRHLGSGVLQRAADRRVAVFIRSVFLQGLLLMPEAEIPAKLQGILPARRRLQAVAAHFGRGIQELALRYVLSLPGVTSVLIGVETPEQLAENLVLFEKGSLGGDQVAAVEQETANLPEELITPRLW